ncbi:MAG: serine/threonine protein kinase [Fibrobacteres bacterium]|nr:serine/threonine protein kinase [Fibrobacterota bacterium]
MEYGRYRILSQLGQGGMATVYLAEDPLLQRLVAIKVIQAHLSSNSGLMERFTVEAKTIASLRHINIVEVFDFGIQDDQQFLVMEYIDGQNLQAICGALLGRSMPNTVAAAIICQAAEGLTSAEKHGVVHRDIKPENLMFNSEGTLKIADFGIAHIADEGSRTQTGAVLGSPNFMSPEQIEGLRPTNKTDIFSLGGVFYYILTGKLPFTGPSIPVTMRNICERPHPPIVESNPQADPFLIKLVDVLLQKRPEARGDGARWLANQLRAYLGSQGIVDIVDYVKTFIQSLGLVGGGHTLVEGGLTKQTLRPTRSGGSSVGGFPPSQLIKGGATPTGSNTYSRSMADPAEFQTQATTGAMGPSSRSPLVWIGVLLSLCVLVLAGAIIWSRMPHDDTSLKTASVKHTTKGVTPTPVTPTKVPETTNPVPSTTGNPTAFTSDTQPVNPIPTPQSHIGTMEPANPVHYGGKVPVRPRHTGRENIELHHTVATHNPEPRPVPAPAPVHEPEAAQTGFVLIKSAPPFAALTINGKPQGETPMNAYLEVPVGKCHIEIVHRLSPPFDTTIMVSPGFRREFKFKLDR